MYICCQRERSHAISIESISPLKTLGMSSSTNYHSLNRRVCGHCRLTCRRDTTSSSIGAEPDGQPFNIIVTFLERGDESAHPITGTCSKGRERKVGKKPLGSFVIPCTVVSFHPIFFSFNFSFSLPSTVCYSILAFIFYPSLIILYTYTIILSRNE